MRVKPQWGIALGHGKIPPPRKVRVSGQGEEKAQSYAIAGFNSQRLECASMLGLRVAILLPLLAVGGSAADRKKDMPLPQPVATLDTTELLPAQRDLTFTTVAFSSDNIIEVVSCPTPRRDATCPSAVFGWNDRILKHVAQAPSLDRTNSTSSVNGKRLLFDSNDRYVSKLQHMGDDIRAATTFGMIYPEEVNREVVQVIDATTRKSCFDWRHTFPMTNIRRRSGAISPSGEFVAIKLENKLSVYRLPSACAGPRLAHPAK